MHVHLPVHYTAACPDCPGSRLGLLEDLVGPTKSSCAFETATVEARAYVPAGWTGRHAFGWVRRGVLVRQRVDAQGRAIAVDAAGPGCIFPIEGDYDTRPTSAPCDYAATDLIVCLCPSAAVERALDDASPVGRELLALHHAALERVERITQARGAGSVRERVASLIGALADTLSPPRTREQLPSGLQQRDLAKLVGVRHETFCRVLGELEREGIVQRETEGIRIVDRRALDRC